MQSFLRRARYPLCAWRTIRRAGLHVIALALLSLFAASGTLATELTHVRVPPFDRPRDGRPGYFLEVLDLALRKTVATHGPYRVTVLQETLSLERAVTALKAHELIDLIFIPPNPGITDGLRPVPVSLLKELNNYRILLIRKGEQERFDRVQSLQDLKALTAGLGSHWVDTKIMRRNGFRVEGSVAHDKLFEMLAAGRFDYFPRGIYEVQGDFQKYGQLGLAMEQKLFLYYDAPFYFFVNSENKKLAKRIEAGLNKALVDGSFDQLLNSYAEFRAALRLQQSSSRKVLRLAPLNGSAAPGASVVSR